MEYGFSLAANTKVYRTDDICEEIVPDPAFLADVYSLLKKAEPTEAEIINMLIKEGQRQLQENVVKTVVEMGRPHVYVSTDDQLGTLQLLMDEIKLWSNKTFGEFGGPIPKLYHLMKEVPEAIEACKRNAYSVESLFEFADCFMLLLDAVTHSGINAALLLEATNRKLEINKDRKWGKPDENGVVEHIGEPSDPEVGHAEYLVASGQMRES